MHSSKVVGEDCVPSSMGRGYPETERETRGETHTERQRESEREREMPRSHVAGSPAFRNQNKSGLSEAIQLVTHRTVQPIRC